MSDELILGYYNLSEGLQLTLIFLWGTIISVFLCLVTYVVIHRVRLRELEYALAAITSFEVIQDNADGTVTSLEVDTRTALAELLRRERSRQDGARRFLLNRDDKEQEHVKTLFATAVQEAYSDKLVDV